MSHIKELEEIFKQAQERFDEENFHEIAYELLNSLNINEKFRDDLWEEVLNQNEFPEQNYGLNTFGYPAVTLFKDKDISLDVYNWPMSNLSIHSHNFNGAFKVLGEIVHQITFSFTEEETIEDFSFGDLKIKEKEFLKYGDCYKIEKFSKFIHFVYHKNENGASVVLRTNEKRDDWKPLSMYLYPKLKISKDRKKEMILMKKFELLVYKSVEKDISDFLKGLSDLDVFRVYLSELNFGKFVEEIEQEVLSRPNGEIVSTTKKKHHKFIEKIKKISNI